MCHHPSNRSGFGGYSLDSALILIRQMFPRTDISVASIVSSNSLLEKEAGNIHVAVKLNLPPPG